MSSIYISLFNVFRVLADDVEVTRFRSDKARALLAYVAAQREQAHSRTALATLLWPELPDKSAKTNLRNVLSNLRKVLPAALTITRQTVALNADVWVDVSELAGAEAERAVELYTGEFLRGFGLEDSAEFDEWVAVEREKWHIHIMQTLDGLLTRLATQQQWDKVTVFAQRQLQIEAWHETAHRHLMQALAAQGQRAEAMAQFERCRAVLADELGIEPSATTRELFAQLQTPDKAVVRHNLPPELTYFVGRADEVAQVGKWVQQRRLVTVQGMGGVGKTRVGLKSAETLLPHFPDGIWFVPLVDVDRAENVPMAIMSALNLFLAGAEPPLNQLISQLRDKQLLLILDNVEQLAENAAHFLRPLLEKTAVHILLTSRERVRVAGEKVVALGGLPLADAVELFHERSTVEVADADGVTRICRLVEGLPLGIELAAHWTEHFSAEEIATEITQFLRTDDDNRHSSLRAVFDYSWQLLSPHEQKVLAQLSVFRGGFGREALPHVTDATLTDISSLIHKSLVRRVVAGRYELHEVVRGFSAEKVPPADKTPDRHAHHYLGEAENLNAIWFGEQFADALQIAQQDWSNYNAAWQHAISRADWSSLDRYATGVRNLYRFRVDYEAGVNTFAEAVRQLQSAQSVLQQRVFGRFFAAQAWFLVQQRDHPAATTAIHTALAIAETIGDVQLQMDVQVSQQVMLTQQDRFAESLALGEQLMALADAHNAPFFAAEARNDYGFVQLLEGRYVDGEATLQQAEADYRAVGDLFGIITALRNQGIAIMMQGRLEDSAEKFNQGLQLAQQRQDREREMFVASPLGTLYKRLGDYSRALEIYQRQVDYDRAAGLQANLAVALANCGQTYCDVGLYDRAETLYAQASPLMEQFESQTNWGGFLLNQGQLAYEKGAYAAAQSFVEQSAAIIDAVGHVRIQIKNTHLLGRIQMAQGKWEDANNAFQQTLQHFESAQSGKVHGLSIAGLVRCALETNEMTQAQTYLAQLLPHLDQLTSDQPQIIYYDLYLIFSTLDDQKQAAHYLERAHQTIQERADNISDPLMRISFLTNPPLHRAIVTAWEA